MEDLIASVERLLQGVPGLPPLPDKAVEVPAAVAGLAATIDHTLLKPEATPEQVERLCDEALAYGFASVCINPTFVELCAGRLAGSPVAVCTVVGFPLGATTTEVKLFEAQQAIERGAREIDMVIAIGRLKAGQYSQVYADIAAVTAACHTQQAICKVIIETGLLSDEEKVAACLLAVRAGADFVKTSTGFSGGGASIADISLMRRTVGPTIGVKASGGVRTRADAEALIAAGATRIGASAGVAIVGAEPTGTAPQERY